MLNKYCSYDIHTNNKINVKHSTDILLKIEQLTHEIYYFFFFLLLFSFFIIIIILLLLLLLLLFVITILLVIYNYIHETKHISEVYDVAAIL